MNHSDDEGSSSTDNKRAISRKLFFSSPSRPVTKRPRTIAGGTPPSGAASVQLGIPVSIPPQSLFPPTKAVTPANHSSDEEFSAGSLNRSSQNDYYNSDFPSPPSIDSGTSYFSTPSSFSSGYIRLHTLPAPRPPGWRSPK